MSENPRPTDADADVDADVVIAVVRSGGIAGIRRRWRVEAEPTAADEWIALIDRCPWDDDDADAATGADRFVWSIQARTPAVQHERELPDSALAGPWLELVQAVRAAQRR